MKKGTVLFTILLCVFFVAACGQKSAEDAGLADREPLVKLMDQYLEALVKHDSSALPLASGVKLVENIIPTPIGEGFWKTATGGPTEFKIYVSDPADNQVGFMGIMEDDGKPVLVAARLKVENDRIAEITHMVSSMSLENGVPDTLITPREGLVTKLTPAERVPREQMVKAAFAYYDAIQFNDGTLAPFADDCQRRENGGTAANNRMPPPAEGEGVSPFGSMADYGRMKCGEQLSTGIMGYITHINQRRLAAVDEEMGLVMIYSMFNHDGDPNPLKIKNVPGVTESPNDWGQFTVPAVHIYKIKNGQVYEIEAGAIVGVPYQATDGWTCNRKCLTDLMDNYLAALSKRDASSLPLSANVKIVENGETIDTNKGLWQTATGGPTAFKIYTADPDNGEVGFMGVIEENKNPALAAVRLKIADGRADGKITEIDHLIVHGDQPLNANMSKLRAAFLERLPKTQRIHREKMVEVANLYYESILKNDGTVAPFADTCQRRENGGITAGNPSPDPNSDFAVFEKMKCAEQLSTNVMSYITDINDRRIFAVDEELGLVMAFSVFRHDGEPKVMQVIGVSGVTERKNDYGPFDLPAAHVYKIRDGKLDEIEAIGFMSAAGYKTGW